MSSMSPDGHYQRFFLFVDFLKTHYQTFDFQLDPSKCEGTAFMTVFLSSTHRLLTPDRNHKAVETSQFHHPSSGSKLLAFTLLGQAF